MKILIVSEMSVPHATGGGETRYALLARELVRMGHTVTWLSMLQRDSPRDECIDGVRHIHRGPRIDTPPQRSLRAKLVFMAAIFWHLLRHRHDVVDCQTYAPLPAAWLACRLTRTPLVATIHDTSAPVLPSGDADQWLSAFDRRLASRVERGLYRLSYTHVLTVSQAVKTDLVQRMGLRKDKVSVVSNAIDIDRIDAVARHPVDTDLIFVGRMVPHKHPEMFLAAAALVSQRRRAAGRPPLRLRMIGGGPLAATLQTTATTLGLAACLDLRGEVQSHDEVIAHVKAACVLVLPSTREGFGLVLAEAMASGTAVAAYRLPPVVETLGPALQDCLAEPGDVEGLAQTIGTLLDDDTLRQGRIAQGRGRVEAEFGARTFAAGVLAVYRTAIQARPGQKSA